MTDAIKPVNQVVIDIEEIADLTETVFNPTTINTEPRETSNSPNTEVNGGEIPYLFEDEIEVIDEPSSQLYEYKPLIIKFITGIYNGQVLNLGSNIREYSNSQTANWQEKEGQKQRVGIEFQNISPRQLSFTVDFYSPNEDVSPLVEDLAHLQEIMAETNEPSRVDITIGKTKYKNAVCTSLSNKYERPLPLHQGFRYATVTLEFKISGGVGSPYQTAAPFADTALQIFTQAQTAQQLRENAFLQERRRFISCLEDEESERYEELLADLVDSPTTITQLPDNLFLQVSIGGLPTSVTNDNSYRSRLRKVLAQRIIERDLGAAKADRYSGLLANNNNVNEIPASDRDFLPTYNEIYNGILAGNISNTVSANAIPTLNAIGKCGRFMAQTGGLKIVTAEKTVDSSWALANFNQLLADNKKKKVTDLELRQILQLPNNHQGDTILSQLQKAGVFASKEDFITQFGGLVLGDEDRPFNAYNAWSTVLAKDNKILTEINTYLATATDAKKIRDRFAGKGGFGTKKMKENTAALLAGSSFSSKEAFLKRIYQLEKDNDTTSSKILSLGNTYWYGFERNATN